MDPLVGTPQKILRTEESLQWSMLGNVVEIDGEDVDLVPDVGPDQLAGGVVSQVQLAGQEDQVDRQSRSAGC